jgi:hypothetical protein
MLVQPVVLEFFEAQRRQSPQTEGQFQHGVSLIGGRIIECFCWAVLSLAGRIWVPILYGP